MLTPEVTKIVLLIALLAIVAGLFIQRFKPTGVFTVVVLFLTLVGIIELPDLLADMANSSIITIFLLIFITASLKEHFNLLGLMDRLFRNIRNPRVFLLSFTTTVAVTSSVVNNTPIVALFIPYILNWSKKRGFSPSKFLIPLSFAATLGGTITLIGTSTNLVLNGLMISNGFDPFKFTDFLIPGLMVTGTGLLYMFVFSDKLLPNASNLLNDIDKDQRNYIVETLVSPDSKLVNRSVIEGGLRNLDGLYLVEINRKGKIISPVGPQEVLLAGDLLYFAGEKDSVSELIKNPDYGLGFSKTEKFNLGNELELVEALVPAMSDLGGKRVKDTNFRERYDAAIVAIKRDGERLGGKIGDLVLEYGDMLVLTAGKSYRDKIRGAKNLYNLSYIDSLSNNKKEEKKWFGLLALAVITGWIFGVCNLLMGLLILQAGLLVLKLATFDQLKRQFNPDLYLILISAIAFGTALIDTGAAKWITDFMFSALGDASDLVLIAALFLVTLMLTSFVTNVAAVAIVFPIAVSILPLVSLQPTDVFLTIAFAASCSFLTPISYQTNLMVYEPGGYKGLDFLKVGLPLTILYAFICIAYFA